jgi:peptidoglycan hydrolase-like protein with peptidoglycan-binding domain
MEGEMRAKRYTFILWLLVLAVAGCATTGSGVTPQKAEAQQLHDRITALESQLKQQQDENTLLRQQLAKTYTEKKELRMPNGKEIQLALKKAGYFTGTVDGQIGTKTKDAIKKFQSANGLTPDGVIGSRTWQLLSKYLDSATQGGG